MALQSHGHIGQGCNGHQHQPARTRFGNLIELFPGGQGIGSAARHGDRHVSQAVFPVKLCRRLLEGFGKVAVRPPGHGDVVPSEQREDIQGILGGHIGIVVAAHGADTFQIKYIIVGAGQGQAEKVIHTGVGVDYKGNTVHSRVPPLS